MVNIFTLFNNKYSLPTGHYYIVKYNRRGVRIRVRRDMSVTYRRRFNSITCTIDLCVTWLVKLDVGTTIVI